MPNCPNCDKPLEQIPHKRPKQFCNSTCRSNFWQKQQRLKNKDGEKPSLQKKQLPKKQAKIDEPKGDNPNRAEIHRLTQELLSPPKGMTGIDLTIWKQERKDKIAQLRNTQ